MGWRNRRTGTAGAEEVWSVPFRPPANPVIKKRVALPDDQLLREPALPPLAKARLSCRQVGFFRERKIFETVLSLLYLH